MDDYLWDVLLPAGIYCLFTLLLLAMGIPVLPFSLFV